eukprot:245474-Heterocapsa_arctica.AAC.1
MQTLKRQRKLIFLHYVQPLRGAGGEVLLCDQDCQLHQAVPDAQGLATYLPDAVAQQRLPEGEQAEPEHVEYHSAARELLLSLAEVGEQ